MGDKQLRTGHAIGLALSGGGVRAAAFHAGVLRYLAEKNHLEDVVHVSSVSGGSLFAGMTFRLADYQWPSSARYLNEVLPKFRETLTAHSLQDAALARLLVNPANWRFIFSRANVLAQTISDLWDIKVPLGAMKSAPVWSINCTPGETGRRFRFKNGEMGDYELGYARATDFPLATAMAISAAFPGGIGPVKLQSAAYQWEKRSQWGAAKSEPIEPLFFSLNLYDGGIYDNLGFEPMFDVGSQSLKVDSSLPSQTNYLIVSDAGSPLPRQSIPHQLNPFRFKRLADIAFDQNRALRVRSFVSFLKKFPDAGAYVQIGADATTSIQRFEIGKEHCAAGLKAESWLSLEDARRAATYSTTLRKMTIADFDLLARHGYETAKWNVELMSAGKM